MKMKTMTGNNPLLRNWDTPFETPPFGEIQIGHYSPAIKKAIRLAIAEIRVLAGRKEEPDFANTVEALDRAGELLGRIVPVLFNLNSAETSKELQTVTQEVSPALARFSNDITLNRKLFSRIKQVYDKRTDLGLSPEGLTLAEKKMRSFILGGASLKITQRKRFREISEELSKLSLKFDENVLEETNSFELHLTSETELAGLPSNLREQAAGEAEARNRKGWVFTLHFPSYIPFMQYSDRRDLREKMFRAYSSRGFRDNDFDNKALIIRITELRIEMAQLLGFRNYAAMILGDRMAENEEKVGIFLEKLYEASRPAAERDFRRIEEFAHKNGHEGKIERWDWAYYAEKLKKELYDIDDEILKPYFSLDKAEQAIFSLATELYGITFTRRSDIPVYHPEVRTFEVRDSDGSFLSLLYTDYHPRPGKSGGAWMTSFRDQRRDGGEDIRPLISIVANFTRPGSIRPSLLSFTELTTFLHEFGHALHGMLSRCTYESLSGTSVARDFVELPSQFMENYAFEKEWLDRWAVHFETGEKIPAGMINRIREASNYNEGYSCFRQLGFALLDMGWHTLGKLTETGVAEFEKTVYSRTELFPPVDGTCISTSFSHIFGGGYAAGYYGYKWAEVLDADAFSLFRKKGIFDRNTAEAFRKNILEKGGGENPLDLYIRFRGQEPSIDPFLERSGLK